MRKMFLLLFLALSVYPVLAMDIPSPEVEFGRFIGPSATPYPSEYGSGFGNFAKPDPRFKPRITALGSFRKLLRIEKTTLINTLKNIYELGIKTEEFKIDKYEVVKFNKTIPDEYKQYGEKDPIDTAFYIFEKNICVGYFLIDDFEITEVMNDPIVQKIKSLPSNNSYLNKLINFYTGTRMDFHQRRKGKYVEKYGLLYTEGNRVFLYLDSFYPKEFEAELRKHLVQVIKKSLKDKLRN